MPTGVMKNLVKKSCLYCKRPVFVCEGVHGESGNHWKCHEAAEAHAQQALLAVVTENKIELKKRLQSTIRKENNPMKLFNIMRAAGVL